MINTLLYPGQFEIGGAIGPVRNPLDNFDKTNYNNGIFQVHEGLAELYRSQRTNKTGPWMAVVLHVDEYIDPGEPGTFGPVNYYNIGGSGQQCAPRTYLRVWARRYPDDQSIPQPDWSFIDPSFKNAQRAMVIETEEQRLAVIKAHDVFRVPIDMWGFRRHPVPGDLVGVTFDDILNQKNGRLLDFIDPGINPPQLTDWANSMMRGALGQFADITGPLSDVFQQDKGPQIREPTAAQMREAKGIVEKMCPGPSVAAPNNLQFVRAAKVYNGAKIQTVIWQNGRVVWDFAAPYMVAMFLAARRSGIELNLASAVRTQHDNITGELLKPFLLDEFNTAEAGMGIAGTSDTSQCVRWDGTVMTKKFLDKIWTRPKDSFSASQAQCRLLNCGPEGKELTREAVCKPLTGFPTTKSKYPYSHGSGGAHDVGSNMVDTGESPNPNISEEYKWMCENAWKFGFVRSVRSERWHWELRIEQSPRPHVFTLIPKNHGSWDGQFNENRQHFPDPEEASIKRLQAEADEAERYSQSDPDEWIDESYDDDYSYDDTNSGYSEP